MSKFKKEILSENELPPPKGWVGFIDYNIDFEFPQSEVSFHWWDNMYTTKHCHNHYEIFIITEGKTSHTLNDKKSELLRGSMVFLRPEDYHQFEPVNGFKSQHINIGLTENKLKAISTVMTGQADFLLPDSENFYTLLSDRELDYFLDNAQRINLIKKESPQYSLAISIITTEMIIEALALVYKRKLAVSKEYPDWFNELLQKLHSPDVFSYTINDIYTMSNYSPPVIIKYFKEYTGETIVSYFTKIKINFACNMLRNSNFSILDIANLLSYDSISHFNKVFKKHIGKTPSEYRKQMQIPR